MNVLKTMLLMYIIIKVFQKIILMLQPLESKSLLLDKIM